MDPAVRYPDFDEIYVEGSSTYQLFQSVLTREWSATKRPSISLPPPPTGKMAEMRTGRTVVSHQQIAFDQNDKPVHVSELFCRANASP